MGAIERRYRSLVYLTWFLTLDLIMFGAFVRLSDSGLGCPDWPGCYGSISPFGASQAIHTAYLEMPYGPVSWVKAWIEMVHRYVGASLGLLIIAIAWMAWRHQKALRQSATLATLTLFTVCLQGALGAWTVTHKLMPIVVTTHLLGGISVLALMTCLATRASPYPTPTAASKAMHPWLIVALGLLIIQIALGGWVSSNYAALACLDFPTCHGEWIPEMDFQQAYTFLRPLGLQASGEPLPQKALTAIHWVHRNTAWLVFLLLGASAYRLLPDPALRRYAALVLGLLCAQFITGLSTIFFRWPLFIAVLHNGGAAALVLSCVTILVRLSYPSLFLQGKRYDESVSRPSLHSAPIPGSDQT